MTMKKQPIEDVSPIKKWWFSTVLLVFGGVRIKNPTEIHKTKTQYPKQTWPYLFSHKSKHLPIRKQTPFTRKTTLSISNKKTHTPKQSSNQLKLIHPLLLLEPINQMDRRHGHAQSKATQACFGGTYVASIHAMPQGTVDGWAKPVVLGCPAGT